MNKTNLSLRNIAALMLVAGLSIGTINTASAKKSNIEILSAPVIKPSVSFVASDATGSAYVVKVEAAAPVKFELVIKDRAGITLFSQVYESASFTKTFKILEEDVNSYDLTFSVKGLPDGIVNTFKVSTEEKAVTEVAVVKTK